MISLAVGSDLTEWARPLSICWGQQRMVLGGDWICASHHRSLVGFADSAATQPCQLR